MGNKSWLYLKRAFVVLMGSLLVWQTFGTDVTSALANSAADTVQALTQPAATADDGVTDAGAASDGTTDGAADASDDDAATNDGADVESGDAAAMGGADAENDDAADDADGQSDDAAIMPVDESGNEYHGDADPVEVTTESGTVNVSITYDEEGTHDWGGEAITANDELHASVNIVFNKDKKPTLEQPNVSYTLPSGISVTDQASRDLYDSNNQKAGTWQISNNQVVLKFSEDWLNAHQSEVTAYFKIQFSLADKTKGDGDSTSFTFPGTTTQVTIPAKDGGVDGSKSAGAFDSSDNTYSWTIKVTPKTAAHSLVVNDTIGSNLSFVDGSFAFTDANGNALSGVTYSTNGQSATFNLGDRTSGDYYITYKTQVSQAALDALGNNEEIGNVENKYSWSWGTTNPQSHDEVTVNPNKVKYSLVSKSASGTNTDITWTVQLNTGSLKADMGGYLFADQLGSGHHFINGTQYTVTDANGNTIASGDVDYSSDTLEFNLPSDAGKQQLTVTYHTAMDNAQSITAVKNTSKLVPNGTGIEGEAEAYYTPTDERVYVEKSLVSHSDDYASASWSSTVKFSNMSDETDVSKVQWVDTISRSTWASFGFGNVVLKAGSSTLVEGVDYTISGVDSSTVTVSFLGSDTVKGLVGTADVVITYDTTLTNDGGTAIASGQRFTNTSVVNYDGVKKGEASANYSVVTVPSVIKTSNGYTWDASYQWSDGTTGAWIISWEAWVNSYGSYHDSILDLGTNDIALTDTLPEGMEYKAGSFTYVLEGNDGYNNVWEKAGTEPIVSGQTVTFKVSAAEAATDGSWVGKAKFKFKTAVKGDISAGQSKEYSNTASAESGEYSFPAGTGTATVKNDVLSKSHSAGSDDAHVRYTINVNPNAADLADGDTLVLSDTMSATLSYSSGSLKVTDGNGNDVTSACSLNTSNVTDEQGNEITVLTLSVPDATKLTVTYECMPLGYIGQQVTISNNVALSGMSDTAKYDSASWTVAKSKAGADAVSYGLTVVKSDQDDNTKKLEGAEFKLWEVDLATGEKTSVVDTLSTGADGTATFGSKESPLEASKLYFVEETAAPAGYEVSYGGTYVLFYPATATSQAIQDFEDAYDAAVKLGHTPVVGTVSDEGSTGPGITFNVYDKQAASSTSVNLAATKTLTGRAMSADEFDFEAVETVGGQEKVVATAKNQAAVDGASSAVTFSAITYYEAGTHTYTIREVTGGLAHVSYDPTTYKAVVTVEKDAETGKLKTPVVTYTDSAGAKIEAPSFANTYDEGSADGSITFTKVLTGLDIASYAGKFRFNLVNENGQVVDSASNDASGSVTFEALSFTEAGEYKFTFSEVNNRIAGITYDGSTYGAAVTVAAGMDGSLRVSGTKFYKVTVAEDGTKTWGDEVQAADVKFTNSYAATGEATISVDKSVAGGTEALASESFTFELYHANEQGNIEGDAIETVSTTAGQRVSFTKLNYSQVGNKTYRYVIKETGHNEGAWFAATNVGVTVNTTDDGKGNLSCEVLYNGSEGDAAKFVNTYAPATVQLKVAKTVNGGDITTGEKFTFVLKDSEGKQIGNAITATKDSPTAAFDAVTVTAPGTYTYTIHETSELGDGWTNDSDFTAKVTVERDAANKKLVVSKVEYNDSKRGYTQDGAYIAKFDDTYKAVGNAQIRVNKKVNGATDAVKNETFCFQLKDGDKVLSTAQTKAGGTTTFGGISFSTADIGKTFNYTIHETGHNTDGWTADSDVPVEIKVTGKDGGLVPEVNVTYGNNRSTTLADGTTAAAFTNKYEVSGAATFSVYKTVNGSATAKQDETFTFDLYNAVEVDGQVQKVGEAIDRASTKAGGTGKFSEVKITKEGTYYYYVHETGHNTAGWTADDDVLVTVVAKDKDGKGKLSVTVTYSRASADGNAAAFDDKFEAAKGTISVEKTVNGGDIAEGEKFTFTLTDKDGKQVGEEITATKDAPTVSFGELEFEKVGTYTYTVHETTELADGWTNDDDVTVELTVADVDGKLAVTKTSYTDGRGYDKDGNHIAQFDDTYEAVSAKGEIKVEKTVNGGPIAEGEKFTFTLLGEDGKQVEGTKEVTATKDAPTVSFGVLEFDHAGTYVYTVHETSELGDGWTNDDDFAVTFTVELGEDRNLHITNVAYGGRAYEADGSVVVKFDNKFEAPKGEDTEQARKRLAQTGDPFGNGPVAVTIAAAGLACLAGALAAARRRRQE